MKRTALMARVARLMTIALGGALVPRTARAVS